MTNNVQLMRPLDIVGTQPKMRIVNGSQRIGFNSNATTTADNIPVLLRLLYDLPPLSSVMVKFMQLWFGLDQAPADASLFRLWLSFIADPSNLPDEGSMTVDAIWQAHQHWQAVGTPADLHQLLTRAGLEFDNDAEAPDRNNIIPTDAVADAIVFAISSNIAVAVRVAGVLYVKIKYLVRTWGNDAWSFDGGPNEKNNEGLLWEEAFSQ